LIPAATAIVVTVPIIFQRLDRHSRVKAFITRTTRLVAAWNRDGSDLRLRIAGAFNFSWKDRVAAAEINLGRGLAAA
jgi:hypothetical protein